MFGLWTFVLLEAFELCIHCLASIVDTKVLVDKKCQQPERKCSMRDMQEYLPSYSFGGRGSGVGTWSIHFNLEPKIC
jgi:hypothetical protein